MSQTRRLILASSSTYRRELLGRLGLPFEWMRPDTDEAPLENEAPKATAARLAVAKARAVAPACRDALIIGSDQVASCDGRRLDKPGNHENASAQLAWLSGRTASFDTAVCLLDTRSGRSEARVVPCRVRFRTLSAAGIEAYLRREEPYDCAGSAKSEALGIALIAAIETSDPTALVGLPLIALCDLLDAFGLSVL